MKVFILLAIAMTIVAAGLIVVPLVRRTQRLPVPSTWAAFIAAGVLVFGAAVLYITLSNYSWRGAPEADSPQGMVRGLARRLERNPDDLAGWLMLGRSYVVLNQIPQALRAYGRADRLAHGQNVEALVGLAEALALNDEAELDGRAGRIFEKALQLDPKSSKALFYGAAAAVRRGDPALARERFTNLLMLDPPANIKPLLQEQIAAIDRQLGGAPPPASSSLPAATSARAAVRVKVVLAPALAQARMQAAPLFVVVRDPQNPGPPLAVKRLQSRFPQIVELTPSDSMLAGRSFAAGQQVEVVARIARSGSPIGMKGDPVGRVGYRVGRDGLVEVIIDSLTP